MTPKLIKDYIPLKYEFDSLCEDIEKLNNAKASTVVKGSYPDYPFTEHPVKISGYGSQSFSLLEEKRQRRNEVKERISEIENFIETISDRKIKRIIKLRYMYGYAWNEVADRLSRRDTMDSVRMICKRFFDKLEKK